MSPFEYALSDLLERIWCWVIRTGLASLAAEKIMYAGPVFLKHSTSYFGIETGFLCCLL